MDYDVPMEFSGKGSVTVSGGMRVCLRLAAFLAVFLVLVGPGIAASASTPPAGEAAASDGVTGSRMETPPEMAVASWSPRDFRNARPAEPPLNPSGAFEIPDLTAPSAASTSVADGPFVPTGIEGFPLRTHGKIFFRVGLQEFVCSGTVVSSRGRNIVFTAGHCVYDTDQAKFVDQLVFVPAYDGNSADPTPLGSWGAAAVFTTTRYVNAGQLSHDIGVAVLQNPIEGITGSRPIAFDLDPAGRQFTIFGYPAKPTPPYDGKTMIGCRSETVNRDSGQGSPFPIAGGPCDMQGGSSGGGWITGGGYLNSVVSYGYCDSEPSLCGLTFGPYFTDQAKGLYTDPAVGGSTTPTVRFVSGPAKRVRAKSVKFKVSGNGSTPLNYRCKLDRQTFVGCGASIRINRLSRGKHVLKVIARDQTGKQSRAITRAFRVVR